uniref:Eukaryotic translation initiation factor 2-alpha kinase 1 n=1 Tax=Clytia hemisphaerica TaxID=252671 RepID=A0A7M5V9V2_9CNID
MSFDDPFNSSTSFSSFQREDFNTASSASSDDFVEFERFTSFEGDSDEESQSPFSQSSFGAASNNEVAIHSQQPLNHLMFISMLEHICVLYTQDENASDALFKNVCEKLKSGMLIPDLAYLDDFKAVRMKYQSALKSLMEGSVQTLQPKFELLKTKEHIAFNSSAVNGFHTQSLYNEMFSMEEHIASGGFGKVVKAQNKLDYKFYAIKKIPLVDTDVKKILQTLREVQIFSNLEHTNIVRYHSSWLEHGVETFLQKDVHSNQEKNVRRTNIEKSATTEAEEKEFIPVIFQQPIQSHGVFGVGISHLVHPPSHPPKLLGLPAGSNDEVNKEPSGNHIVKKRPTLRFNNNAKLLKMTLFIQMELCSRTLRDWLHQRNNEYNEEIGIGVVEVRDMARQISSAVHYIHRQGMLHRDMKVPCQRTFS